ncbi:MAG: competence/damage-inducible protein A [Bacteroidia bacterium]|nr:competence/damage-inducible protein A [Bacteroidia bacterium]
MLAEIITIGDEILIGQIVESNSAYIAEQFTSAGIQLNRIISVGDNPANIINALSEANQKADIVIITGGLGPTKDDITKAVLCEYFNTQLIFDEEAFTNIERHLKYRNIPVNELNRKQAEVPENCKIILNTEGTAPGLWFEKDGTIFIAMPGVPFEMEAMMKHQVIPVLKKRFKLPNIVYKTVNTQGAYESQLAEILNKWEENLKKNGIKLAYLPSPGIIQLRLSCEGSDRAILTAKLENETEKLKKIIPDFIYGYDEDTLPQIVGKLLIKAGKTLCIAESCTGGMLSHLITSVPGCSDWFRGSVIAYSNEIKEKQLNVSPDTLCNYGAVSKQTVEEMANGVRHLLGGDFAIAVSGIAGPSGGTNDKPVGTTWIAVASSEKSISQNYLFGNDRSRNIIRASLTALNMLRKIVTIHSLDIRYKI